MPRVRSSLRTPSCRRNWGRRRRPGRRPPGTCSSRESCCCTGWLQATPWARLQHYPRYLKAAALRLDKLRTDPARDARRSAELQPLLAGWLRAPRPLNAELEQFGWLLEELRVSLYAQELKTPVPVSAKRLAKLWQSIRR